MIHYFIRAYLDDYGLINCEVDRKFHDGKCACFYLLLGQQIEELTIIGRSQETDFVRYRLRCEQLQIGQPYQIMATDGYTTPLVYRYIVKTERFNEEFLYSGSDLGSQVKGNFTSFKLWAPTADAVTLKINGGYYPMVRKEKGVYSLTFKGNLTGLVYTYLVSVNGELSETTDPYGKASTVNSEKSVVMDRQPMERVAMNDEKEKVIYEVSVRDYSQEGTFRAMMENLDYLKDLGITHLQLLPVNDFGSVNEYHKEVFYNWGYDPVQYQCLEGSYSSDVSQPLLVIDEFRQLVNKAHQDNIRIVLDVVYNHHYYADRSSFSKTVPYYFFRYKDDKLCEGTNCGSELDSEMLMCRKYILDTLRYLVYEFDVDGFRFDLMSFLDLDTMNLISRSLKAIKPEIILYGEGWNMPAGTAMEKLANMDNWEKLEDIGFFNDSFRDIFKGSTFVDNATGYGSGNLWQVSQAGTALLSQRFGDPERSINYVECHDDMTCFDKLACCCINEKPEQLVDRQKLLLSCVLLSQGVSFLHGGQEFCLSKNGLKNSYNASDQFNKLTQERRQKHQDVIDYTKDVIAVKKQHHLNSSESVSFSEDQGRLIYKVADLTIIINPSEEEYDYEFEGKATMILNRQGSCQQPVENSCKVGGIEVAVLESEKNDQQQLG